MINLGVPYFALLLSCFAYSQVQNFRVFLGLRGATTFFLVALVCYFVGYRSLDVGVDVLELYRPVYENIKSIEDVFIVPIDYSSYDSQLYWAFLGLAKLLSLGLNEFYFLHCVLLVCLCEKIARNLDVRFICFVAVYFSSVLFLMSAANTLRQGVAVLLFLLLATLLARRKFRISLLVAVSLALVHGSGALVVAITAVSFSISKFLENDSRRTKYGVILLFFALSAVAYIFVSSDFFQDSLQRKLVFYLETSEGFSEKPPIERPWVILSALTVPFVIFGKRICSFLGVKLAEVAHSSGFWRALYVGLIIVWFATINVPALFERFGDYVAGLQILFSSIIFNAFYKKSNGFFLAFLALLSAFAFFNYSSPAVIFFFE